MRKILYCILACILCLGGGFAGGFFFRANDWISPAAAEAIGNLRENMDDLERENRSSIRDNGILRRGLSEIARGHGDFRETISSDFARFNLEGESIADRYRQAINIIREVGYYIERIGRKLEELRIEIP